METVENSLNRLPQAFFGVCKTEKPQGKPTQNLWKDVENFSRFQAIWKVVFLPNHRIFVFAVFHAFQDVENRFHFPEKAGRQTQNQTFPQPPAKHFSKSANRRRKGVLPILSTANHKLLNRFSTSFPQVLKTVWKKVFESFLPSFFPKKLVGFGGRARPPAVRETGSVRSGSGQNFEAAMPRYKILGTATGSTSRGLISRQRREP